MTVPKSWTTLFSKTLPKVEIANIVMFIGDRIGMEWIHSPEGSLHQTEKTIAFSHQRLSSVEAFGFGTLKMGRYVRLGTQPVAVDARGFYSRRYLMCRQRYCQ